MVEGDIFKNKELIERADNIRNYEEAIPVVKKYAAVIRFKKKEILKCVYNKHVCPTNLNSQKNL